MSCGQFSGSDMITSVWLFKLTSMLLDLPTMTRENPIDLRRISNEVLKHLHDLQALKCPTMHWDHLLVPSLTSKLDSLTLREWGTSLTPPPLKQLLNFIAHRCEVLEITTRASITSAKKVEAKSQPNVERRVRLQLNQNATSVRELLQRTCHLLLQKFHGTFSITKGRGNS